MKWLKLFEEFESNFSKQILDPEDHHIAIKLMSSDRLKQSFYNWFERNKKIILVQSGKSGKYFICNPVDKDVLDTNLNLVSDKSLEEEGIRKSDIFGN